VNQSSIPVEHRKEVNIEEEARKILAERE